MPLTRNDLVRWATFLLILVAAGLSIYLAGYQNGVAWPPAGIDPRGFPAPPAPPHRLAEFCGEDIYASQALR